MRIGIDARLYNQTGVGRYIQNLLYYLNRLDRQNEYFIFLDYPVKLNEVLNNNFKTVRVNIHWHSFKEQLLYPLMLSQYRLDLVHFPYYSLPVFYPGKFIVTMHDLTILKYPTGKASTLPYFVYRLKYLAYLMVVRISLLRAIKILVPSNSVANEICAIYRIRNEKIKTIYESGIERYRSSGLPPVNKPYFLYVGNVYPHKNVSILINVFSKFNQTNRNKFHLIIACGRDFFQKKLSQYIIENNLQHNISFLHDASDGDLISLYQNAVCLVCPSLSEGFGLPCLEALKSGCLVVCSDLPVFREIIGPNAVYFQPTDQNSLYQALKKVTAFAPEEKKQRISQGQKKAQEFSWEKMAKETLAVYQEVLS